MSNKTQAGFSLIEIMVALGVFMMFMTAAFALTSQTIATANAAQMKEKAVRYAEQGLEQVSDYYQSNIWPVFASKSSMTPVCFSDGTLQSVQVCADSPPRLRATRLFRGG